MYNVSRIDDLEQAPGDDEIVLSAEAQRLHRFRGDDVAHEPPRRVADQDLAGSRSLLQPRRDVDGIAGDERVRPLDLAGKNLAGVHADVGLDATAELPLDLDAQPGDRVANLDRRAGGA